MGCQRGKPSLEPKPGRFKCEDCGVVRKKKGKLCAPKKIKKE
ncbi:MAG: hypothetical protein WD845_08270 [Pirellulales bacterium]